MNSTLISPDISLNLLQTQQSEAVAKNLQKQRELEKTEEAAQDFEAVFFAEMLKPMFENLETDGAFGGGSKGEEVFQGMMLQEYGKLLAETSSVGIADQVKEHLLKIQEQNQR